MSALGDFMWDFAEWLSTSPLAEFAGWLSTFALSRWIQENFWVIPTVQTVHILAIAALFGSAFMISLRILGAAGRGRTMRWTAQRFMPWMWWGFVVLLVTGVLMVIGEPHRELTNPAFWIKMGLIVVAVPATAWFHRSAQRNAAFWEGGGTNRIAVRSSAVGAIAFWAVIIVLGRWIAYAPAF